MEIEPIGAFDHISPASRVLFGAGRLVDVAAECRRLGPTVALIASHSASAAADRIAADLGPVCVARLDGATPHVPVDLATGAADRVRTSGAAVLLSIGGGSATGLAKAVALESSLPLVAVPTTYAGSELTAVWGRSSTAGKQTGRDERVRPATVVYDPDLTATLPPATAAASGMNALAHVLPALATPGLSPVHALLAQQALRHLVTALPAVCSDGGAAARERALYGAFLAGAVLGAVPTGLQHRLAHAVGGRYRLSHAGIHSALLPQVVGVLEQGDPAGWAAAREAWPAPDGVAVAVFDLAVRIGAPTSLAELGLDPAGLSDVAAECADPATPVGRLEDLLGEAHLGRRPAPVSGPPPPGSRPVEGAGAPPAAGPAWLSDAEQAAWRSWLDVYRLVLPTLDRQLRAASPASFTDYEVLVALSEAQDGRLRMAQVADRTLATRSAVTRTVDRLVTRGWVQRAPSTDDQRGQYAELTALGWRTIRDLAPGHVQAVRDSLVDLLEPADLVCLQAIGRRVRVRLER